MSDVLTDVMQSKKITASQVLDLRRALYNDGVAEGGEVDRLFTIDEAATDCDPSWTELFVEAVTDYIVMQVEPQGHISEENADWLIDRISRDGVVKTASELEILAKVVEKAQSSPQRLVSFALGQVKKAVLEGEGPLARGKLSKGIVSRDEAEFIRRILFAFGGDGNIAVTRDEAEILFDINDATVAAENDPAWNDLFVKAIANFMMAASGYQVPSRQEALRREEWLDEPTGGIGGFFGRMAAGGLRGALNAYRRPEMVEQAWAAKNARMDAAIKSAETITAEEAEWLARRMGRDGTFHENEKVLLRFIRDEAPSVHPSLQSLVNKAA